MTDTSLRQAIVQEALTWVGTPFHHQGRLKGVGVDCVGVPIGVARALGLVAPGFDVPAYPRQPDGVSLLALCDQHLGERLAVAALAPADVLVVRFARGEHPQHVGIVVPHAHGLALLHSYGTADGKGAVIVERLSPAALARAVAVYRMPGVRA